MDEATASEMPMTHKEPVLVADDNASIDLIDSGSPDNDGNGQVLPSVCGTHMTDGSSNNRNDESGKSEPKDIASDGNFHMATEPLAQDEAPNPISSAQFSGNEASRTGSFSKTENTKNTKASFKYEKELVRHVEEPTISKNASGNDILPTLPSKISTKYSRKTASKKGVNFQRNLSEPFPHTPKLFGDPEAEETQFILSTEDPSKGSAHSLKTIAPPRNSLIDDPEEPVDHNAGKSHENLLSTRSRSDQQTQTDKKNEGEQKSEIEQKREDKPFSESDQKTNKQILEEIHGNCQQIVQILRDTYDKSTLENAFKLEQKLDEMETPVTGNIGRYNYYMFLYGLQNLCTTEDDKKMLHDFQMRLSGRCSSSNPQPSINILFLIFWIKTMCWIDDRNPGLDTKGEINQTVETDKKPAASGSETKDYLVSTNDPSTTQTTFKIEGAEVGESSVDRAEPKMNKKSTETNKSEDENDLNGPVFTTGPDLINYLQENFRETLEVRCFLIDISEACCNCTIQYWLRIFHEMFFLKLYLTCASVRKCYSKIVCCCKVCGSCCILVYSFIIMFAFLTGSILLIWKFIDKMD